MKKSLLLLSLFALTQFNMQSANNYGLTDAEAKLALALQRSMEENYAQIDDNLTPEQWEQIEREAREAARQKKQLSLAEEVALRARTTKELGASGGFKEGRGIAPPMRPKPAGLKVKPKAAAQDPSKVKPDKKDKTATGGDDVISELERLFRRFTQK